MNILQKLYCDCLIIGGGPAGLTAAIYLARFHRNVIVVDEGKSRARYIKTSYNYPGFTNGIQGEKLLHNLRGQALEFSAQLIWGRIIGLQQNGNNFTGYGDNLEINATKVLLASGIIDEKPGLPHIGEFIYEGAIRFCPICDGFEATDKCIGVLGPLSHIIPKSLFLRTYTKTLHMLPTDHLDFKLNDKEDLQKAGIKLPTKLVTDIQIQSGNAAVIFADGECLEVDILYPAMGARPQSELAIKLGARANESYCVFSDAHQQTSIQGLYVAGDLTTDLSQISVATGQAAIAATHIHNTLPRHFR